MITLIKIGLALAAMAFLYAAWLGFEHWVAAPRVEAQRKADQKFVDAANANAQAAENERDNAKKDTETCLLLAKRQGDLIKDWQRLAEDNAKRAKDAKATADAKAKEAAPRIADLQAKAAAAPKLMACEEELGKAKVILQDQLRRARGLPTTAAPVAPPVITK